MSKQSEAKEVQGYIPKPVPRVCSTCAHFTCDETEHPAAFTWSNPYKTQSNLRCGIGGFAVKKTATCARWAPKA